MRIAFVIHDVRPGGGQDRYALELVNRLSKRHDITVFACSAEQLAPGIEFVRIKAPTRPALLRNQVFTSKVRNKLAGVGWDIVHAAGGALPGATVITAHFCHTGAREAARRWPSNLVPGTVRLYRTLDAVSATRNERRAARHPDLRALIGVSQRTLDEWTKDYCLSATVRAAIPNGVDCSRFRPGTNSDREALRVELGIPASAPVLLLVGALVRKGIETALLALARTEGETHLVAVGAGPHARILALASQLGVRKRLRLVNPTTEIERYYRGSNVLLFPTRYEPFGMVIGEAWASGLPVVTTSLAGALEWASPNENVLVVDDPTDHESLAEATTRILEDPDLETRLSTQGRLLAKHFTWDRVARETDAIYDRALQ